MASQLCIFRARPILWAFVVPKLKLLKKGAQVGGRTFIFSHKQRLRPLGYCASLSSWNSYLLHKAGVPNLILFFAQKVWVQSSWTTRDLSCLWWAELSSLASDESSGRGKKAGAPQSRVNRSDDIGKNYRINRPEQKRGIGLTGFFHYHRRSGESKTGSPFLVAKLCIDILVE